MGILEIDVEATVCTRFGIGINTGINDGINNAGINAESGTAEKTGKIGKNTGKKIEADRLAESDAKEMKREENWSSESDAKENEREKVRDRATAVFFEGPQSYTGEDMAEISIHGSAALAQNLLQYLIKNGARAADRGEFTRRAFLNGKLDLSSAEGVLEMINAESQSELRAAFCEMQGGIRREIESLQEGLTKIIAGVEAALDFPDEVEGSDFIKKIEPIKTGLSRLIESYQSGKLVKNGIKIAVVGGANVGKSSLVNALLAEDRAIVTDIPGTTRDTLEGRFEHKGFKFVITDTAGLRESDDQIELLGMERSLRAAAGSDIILAVSVAGEGLEPRAQDIIEGAINEWALNEACAFETGNSSIEKGKKPVIYIENKTDILAPTNPDSIKISAKTGAGIEKLKDEILEKAGAERGGIIITNARHYEALRLAFVALCEVEQGNIPPECIAEGLLAAYNELGKITGAVGSDEIIDRIFSDFCVGK